MLQIFPKTGSNFRPSVLVAAAAVPIGEAVAGCTIEVSRDCEYTTKTVDLGTAIIEEVTSTCGPWGANTVCTPDDPGGGGGGGTPPPDVCKISQSQQSCSTSTKCHLTGVSQSCVDECEEKKIGCMERGEINSRRCVGHVREVAAFRCREHEPAKGRNPNVEPMQIAAQLVRYRACILHEEQQITVSGGASAQLGQIFGLEAGVEGEVGNGLLRYCDSLRDKAQLKCPPQWEKCLYDCPGVEACT